MPFVYGIKRKKTMWTIKCRIQAWFIYSMDKRKNDMTTKRVNVNVV